MTTLPNYTPFYGGGQVSNPANVILTSGAPSSSVLTENRIGTLAIDNSAGVQYILASKSGGIDTWDQIQTSGEAGSFTTLTNTLAYTLGTSQAANASTIGSGQTSGTIILGAAAGTGSITLGQATNATGQTISIASAASNTGANIVNILNGATPGANTTLNIMGGAGTAGTQTFNVLASGATRAGAINIGTGAAAHVIAMGSSSAGAITVDTAAGISLDAATASNFTVTGSGIDLTLQSVGGSVSIASNEAVATAIGLTASDAAGGITLIAGTNDINLTSIEVIQSLSSAGNDVHYEATNSDNTNSASRAGLELAVGGSSAGDPYINFLVSGAGVYTLGIDNSASDNFVLAASTALGTSDIVTISSSGAFTTAAGITATTGNISSSAGSISAATTITATLGDITATNGNFVGSTSGTGISLNSPSTSGVASGAVIVNGRSGRVTFTSVSIAANADLTLTLTNSSITASSTQIIFGWRGATTGSALSMKSVTPGSGTCAFVVTNGVGATTSVEDIVIDFLVIN